MPDITAKDLAKIKAACDTATPGPWIVGERDSHPGHYMLLRSGGDEITFCDYDYAGLARTWLPRLLADRERLQCEVELKESVWEFNLDLWKADTDKLEQQAATIARLREGVVALANRLSKPITQQPLTREIIRDLNALAEPGPGRELWQRIRKATGTTCEHWLETAAGRIAAGEPEQQVMAAYCYHHVAERDINETNAGGRQS